MIPNAATTNLNLGDNGTPTMDPLKPDNSAGGSGSSGGGLAGGGMGSPTRGPGQPDSKKGGGSGLTADINRGLRGGTPNGFQSSTGATKTETWSGGNTAKNGGPDLRKFLPGGMLDPRRSPAGMDGMTGPYTDLFAKVANRYMILRTTFLP